MKNNAAIILIVVCLLLVLVCDLHFKTILSMKEEYLSLQSEYEAYIDMVDTKVNQMRIELERYKSRVRYVDSVLDDNQWLIEYFEDHE